MRKMNSGSRPGASNFPIVSKIRGITSGKFIKNRLEIAVSMSVIRGHYSSCEHSINWIFPHQRAFSIERLEIEYSLHIDFERTESKVVELFDSGRNQTYNFYHV